MDKERATAERQRKASVGRAVAQMQASPGYKFVMERVRERCGSGKWWRAWVVATEEKAAEFRTRAQGYLAFDALVEEMVNEGAVAEQILKGTASNPSPDSSGTQEASNV